MAIEKSAYLIVRIALVAVGLCWILITLTSHFLTPYLLYDNRPAPAPLVEHLPRVAVCIAVGLTFCVPNRWTAGGFLFWSRLAINAALGLFLIRRGLLGIRDGIFGVSSWPVIPVSIVAILVALALPLSLLWRRRLDRQRPLTGDRRYGLGSSLQ